MITAYFTRRGARHVTRDTRHVTRSSRHVTRCSRHVTRWSFLFRSCFYFWPFRFVFHDYPQDLNYRNFLTLIWECQGNTHSSIFFFIDLHLFLKNVKIVSNEIFEQRYWCDMLSVSCHRHVTRCSGQVMCTTCCCCFVFFSFHLFFPCSF